MVQNRAGWLAVINIAPLCTGLNFGLPSDLFYVDRHSFAWFHRWTGRIFVFHSLLHGISAASRVHLSVVTSPRYLLPILAGVCFILIIPASWPALQRRHTQVALKIHYILGIWGVSALGYHLIERKSQGRWYLLGAICLWVIVSGVTGGFSLISNRPWTHDRPDIRMSASSGLLWLELKLLPRWKIRPGQYLQLWMPRAGPRAWIHLPLLYVVICHNDDTHNIVRMVTRPHTGLMQSLYERSRVSSSSFHLPTTVLGPYGRPVDLLEYGTVVMVVEDIGFFRVLSYIEMLVEASRQRKALVRKLEILWQDDAVAAYPPWVKKWRQEILKADFRGFKILQFKIFCGETTSNDDLPTSYREEDRLCFYRHSVDIGKEMKCYIRERRGDMVVAGE
ncbi:hypothetical protein POX_f07350 [Penicillium oxalicum]|uniref:hypothetical protein n=1 Tax=Penicillium oxalicum TaxID=69781 RepID=UPI0020B67FFD|nr:hypothetical protein POX_f07350 [Penicillium oxalicum]KAI2786997.1 hypothetical protein POX_f07350 [Penicillium oxalicum]